MRGTQELLKISARETCPIPAKLINNLQRAEERDDLWANKTQFVDPPTWHCHCAQKMMEASPPIKRAAIAQSNRIYSNSSGGCGLIARAATAFSRVTERPSNAARRVG